MMSGLWYLVLFKVSLVHIGLTFGTIRIGAIFDTEEYQDAESVFREAFNDNQLIHRHNDTVIPETLALDSDVYETEKSVCSFVDGKDLRVLLVVGRQRTIQTVGQITQPLGIPILGYTTDTVVDRFVQIHNPLLLMLRPSKVDQAQAFLKFFQANFWFNIILFVQDTFVVDGFYDQIKRNVSDPKWNFNTEIISERTTRKSLKVILNFLLTKQPRIVVVHASHTIARRLFSVAKSENLTEINHAWFITETSYTRDHDDLLLYPPGILTIIPNYVDDINDVITDGTNIMLKSVIKLSHSKSLPRSCQSNLTQDYVKAGKKMFGHLSSSTLTGISGDIVFDEIGRLRSSNYVVQNLVTEGAQRFWRQIGHIRGDDISPFGIIWPGESITSRISYGKKKYRVVTNPVKPFVMDGEPHKDYDHCAKDVTCVYINNTGKMETIQALRDYENGVFNESNPYYIRCCRGLSVDLLSRLASDLDFDYNLYIVSDTTYGKEIDGQWNGMVRDLMTGTAHFAVAAFSITRPRVKVIDFTVPYFFSGFSVLYTETQRATNMHAFLEPFDVPVWFAIIISATLTAIAMGIFEWNSPFGLNPWGKKRKQNYTLASGMTMVYSVLFGHIVKTKSPKAWPSKVMQNFWAFSCIFIIASYTANLAAFIAGKHAGVVYSSIHDSRLLDINVGVLPGSAVEGFVKKLNPRLYTKCQRRLVDTTDNAIHQLIHEKLDAYLGDYPILDYARAKLDPECKLRLLVQTFGEDGYGIGLPKGSPLKAPLSEKIQDYHDSGYIEDLIDVHFADSQCYKQRIKTEDSRLSYKHHAGSFVMLCVGIIVGIGILFLEHAIFKWVVPKFRDMPGNSIWKSVHLMFFSQRLHRTITSAELVPANETCKEMLGIMRNRDFMKLFQKSTIKTNKMADAAKRKRLNRNFFDVVEKAKWMKEMEDNNLFGSDPSPASPSPKITEISLRDITQAVDLTEFRKQNRENIGDLSNLFSSLKESNVDDNTWPPPPPDANKASSEAALPLCSPEVEKSEFSLIDVSSGENLVSAGSTPTLDIPSIQIANQPSINIAADLKDDFNYASNSLDKNNHGSNGHSPPGLLSDSLRPSRSKSDLDFIVNIDSGTPNGDLVSKSATDSKHHLHPRFQEVIAESGDDPTCPLVRHLSMQKSKSKDSRTHHPRKRQSVYGNNKTSTKKNMNVEKFTKEELLLMWKSSELDLNQKLAAAKKDKERLESKLAGLQLQRSTHV